MSDPNFQSALDVVFDKEITRPPAAPTGTVLLQVVGEPMRRSVNTKDGEKEIIELSLKPIMYRQADNPTDQTYDLTSLRPQRHTQWFSVPPTQKELFDWQQLCTAVFKIDVVGKPIKMHCAELQGRQCIGKLGQAPAQDRVTGAMYMENTLSTLAPA